MLRRTFFKALAGLGLAGLVSAKTEVGDHPAGQPYKAIARIHGMGYFREFPSAQALRKYGLDAATIRDMNLNNYKYAICRPDGAFNGDTFEIRRYYP